MEAGDPANTLSEAYDIAPTGDTILVVGEEKIQLRVHSVCMRIASKVFDAMFGPRFSEGQPSKGALPKEISMPDDDARAMITLCSVIHHRSDILPDVLEPAALADLTLAADKYDCVLALKYAMNLWLDFKEPVTFVSLGELLIAAYVFDNSNAFQRITQRLITGFSHSYHWLFNEKCDGLIPWSIYHSLETARTRTRVSVQDILLKEMLEYRYHATNKAYAQIQALLDNGLWGAALFNMTVDSAIVKAGEVVYPSSRTEYIEKQSKEARCSKLNHLKAFAGLCLRCVRSDNIDANSPCNVDH